MTELAEPIAAVAERPIELEKFVSQRETERWCKRLSPAYPAADYWLCHEARILQSFQRDQRYAARFISVDLDHRILVTEAAGHPLTHWLSTPVGEQEHPFQRSSDLVRLILASLRALQHLSRQGLVHGGLRPDVIVLRQNDRGEIDFDSLTLIDFGVAHSAQLRVEKPLFIDLASPDAVYLGPALREAVQRDWQTYAKLVGEAGKSTWYELSDSARRQYESVLIPDLAVNAIDWRADLFALGHWFKQISLHRIDYYKDAHQEQLPALIKKMQKPVLSGGFTSLDACIKAFEALEIDNRMLVIPEAPHTAGVFTMQPSPTLHATQSNKAVPVAVKRDDEFSPAPIGMVKRERQHAPSPSSRGRFVGIGIGLIIVATGGAVFLRSHEQQASHVKQPIVAAAAVNDPAPAANPMPMADTATATPNIAAPAVDKAAQAPDPTALSGLSLADLTAAAEHGDPTAQTQLGLRYRKGQGVPADNGKAVEWYRRAADQKHAEAQAYLGFMYMTGRGVRKDFAEAARYSKLAAEQNNATGQLNLALLYLSGRGVPLSKIEGYRWLKKASGTDSTAAERLAEVKRTLSPAELAQAEAQ